MKQIGIIESSHFEVTYTLIRLFDDGQSALTIFTLPGTFRQLQLLLGEDASRHKWVIRERQETNRSFIHRMFTYIRQHPFHLLYLSTIEDNFILYALQLRRLSHISTILTLHDINSYFTYAPSPSLRRFIRYRGKKMLLSTVKAFNVLAEQLAVSLQKRSKGSKPIYNLPGGYFEEERYTSSSLLPGQPIRIVIPGSVDQRRRDYNQAFELLTAAAQLDIKITLIFLGAFRQGESEAIRQRCIDYRQAASNLHVYEEAVIDQDIYDAELAACHFIWSPLQRYTMINDGVREEYGQTICSGNMADAIRHARPLIIPGFLAADRALEPAALRYASIKEMLRQLQALTPDSYRHLQKRMLEAARHYTIGRIRQRYPLLFG